MHNLQIIPGQYLSIPHHMLIFAGQNGFVSSFHYSMAIHSQGHLALGTYPDDPVSPLLGWWYATSLSARKVTGMGGGTMSTG